MFGVRSFLVAFGSGLPPPLFVFFFAFSLQERHPCFPASIAYFFLLIFLM